MPSAADQSPPKGDLAPLPMLVDMQAVSDSLGISLRQVRRFVADGTIPFVRVGHLIRFDVDELNEWINVPDEPGRSGQRDESCDPQQPSPRLWNRSLAGVDPTNWFLDRFLVMRLV